MKFAKRVVQSGGALDLSTPRRALPIRKNTKSLNLARIILKLASVNAYNEREELKHDDGSFMTDTDIADLLSYATTPTKSRKGVEQFVNRLHEAGVSPNLILNSQVKQMLAQRTMHVPLNEPPATMYVEPTTHRSGPDDSRPLNLKRRRSDDRDERPMTNEDERPKRQRIDENLNRMAEAMKAEPRIDWDDDPDL